MTTRRARGADTPQGPGWWKASDGKYYPPELAPAARASSSAAAKKAAAKKAGAAKPTQKAPAKKAAAKSPAGGATKPAAAQAPKPAAAAAQPPAASPSNGPISTPPALEDQIAARRRQARSQAALLAGARAQAALRLLSTVASEEEPQLVGVGGRSLEARTGLREANERAPGTQTLESEPEVQRTGPEPQAERTTETTDRAQPAAPSPAPSKPSAPAPSPQPAARQEPEVAPKAKPEPAAASAAPTEPRPTEEPEAAPAQVAAIPAHQPIKGPEPSKPMGTDVPFMEVKGSALGTDIDRIGEKILIFADRVELRDKSNVVKQTIPYDELAGVEVHKKIMGPTLQINGLSGVTITAKALRPELASGAKAMVEKHAERFRRGERGEAKPAAAPTGPPEDSAPARTAGGKPPPHRSVLVGMLDELHAAGILTDEEYRAKRSLIEPR